MENYPEPVSQLLSCGDLDKKRASSDRWPDYLTLFGIDASHAPYLIKLAQEPLPDDLEENDPFIWASVHAWRALGQLRAKEAVAPLLDISRSITDEELMCDDYYLEEIPVVLEMIGPEAIEPLNRHLMNLKEGVWAGTLAVESLGRLAKAFPDRREQCISILAHHLERHEETTDLLNAFIVSELTDLNAAEHIEIIRQAFKAGKVDLAIRGDVEEIEISLGLRNKRSTPLPEYGWVREPSLAQLFGNYFNSTPPHRHTKVGRNDPCPCGSGKKHKKCCL